MKRWLIGFSMFMLMLGLAGAANAGISYYWDHLDGNNDLTSQYAGTSGYTLYDFNSGSVSWTVSSDSNGQIVMGSGPSYARPGLSDNTYYLSVPKNSTATPVTYTAFLGYDSNYLGLYWGSVDTYNTLYLYLDGAPVATITGTMVLTGTGAGTGMTGNQSSPLTNVYVDITGYTFDTIVFKSTTYAFEVDNVVTHVPEPGTILTLGLALLGLAGLRRKFDL